MLKNPCQPCGLKVLCHVTLPHRSVFPITRSKIPDQLYIVVTVISAECILSYMLKPKASQALPKNSRLSTPIKWSKMWPIFALCATPHMNLRNTAELSIITYLASLGGQGGADVRDGSLLQMIYYPFTPYEMISTIYMIHATKIMLQDNYSTINNN